MRSPHHPKLQSFTLSIALLLAPSIAFQMPAIANPTVQVAQQNTSEIDAAIVLVFYSRPQRQLGEYAIE